MQSAAWLTVNVNYVILDAEPTKPTVYFGYNKGKCKWDNFYCNIILNNKKFTIVNIQTYNLEII